jgi:hypothetical protein
MGTMPLWLKEKNVCFGEEKMRQDLYQLIKLNRLVRRTYKVDNILKVHGHTVLRLPPCYPELYTNELISENEETCG